MPAVYLMHHPDDRPFVEESLLPPLAPLGFERVITDRPDAIENAAVVLVVVSAAVEADGFGSEAGSALRSRTPVIVVYRSRPEGKAALGGLSTAAAIAPATAARPGELWRRLARLLPAADSAPDGDADGLGEALEWSERAFTVLIADAARRNDFAFGSALVATFAAYLATRSEPYPAADANRDLRRLRDERQFPVMRDYAVAAIASGVTDPTVRRQYGQALIELKEFDEAERILSALAADTEPDADENHEAHGLLGRAFKQRYVDAADRADPAWLTTAIAEYWEVFATHPSRVWHGVNAATCLLRAARDGVPVPATDPPDRIAQRVLDVLQARQDAAEDELLDVWDYATRVEALIDLGRFAEATVNLTAYLTHPGMRPFEVTSTYRQFDEVLQLRDVHEGGAILDRLVDCATRLRAGGRIGTADASTKRFLVRTADPAWDPAGVPDLVLGTHLGTVVSIAGSERTIAALLKDPLVISIEESRPAAPPDVERSLPFVGVQEYGTEQYTFPERGANALVAVIDLDIDVLHEAFLGADGSSRIVGVWDQTDPDASGTVPFGRVHTAEDVARYVLDGVAPERLRRGGADGHGTHVASIAAGRPCGAFGGGVSPEARLLVVIPRSTGSIGYSEAYLAALVFIDRTATELGVPVVVNLSQGMNAGAHDGQSALEEAFDNFCRGGRKPGRVIVKAAGNERDKRGHAKLSVPPGGADELRWTCPAGPARKVRVELWWAGANEYRFRLESPLGDRSEWVDRRNPLVEDHFAKQGDYEIELTYSHVDNGDSLLRIEFATRFARTGAPDALWTLAVEATAVRVAGDMHAWIERGGDPPTEFVNHADEEMTLTVPGTARSVITVGAVAATHPVRVGEFSSFGPARTAEIERPDLCAPGVGVEAASSGSGDGVVAKTGTSMAAPHVAGAVALVLSRADAQDAPWPTATQVRGLLRCNTMFENGFWDRGQGFGVLDVRKLMEVGLPTLI